jgi:colanic acid/amylovoran biosynthesis glycosyltransferase
MIRESIVEPQERVVLVWRNVVLHGSETFIRNQTSAMRGWLPRLTGAAATPSALSSPDDTIIYGWGRLEWLRRKAFRLARWSGRLNRQLRADRVALVHAHFGPDAITVHPSARRANLPLIITFHGYDVTTRSLLSGFEGWRYRRRVRKAMAYASKVIAVSDFIAEQVVNRLGADAAKVVVHRIGIPVPASETSTTPTHPEWDVVFVGRLTEKKGVADLMQAVSLLPSAHRKARVAIVGSGHLGADLRRLAADLDVDATFLGNRSPEEVAAVLRASRIFVGPSHTAASGDSEGFGMVFLEAALASLPVVAYRHGGVPEAVQDEVTGLLAPESDVAALSAHIDYLLSNPDVATRMGRAGRERVVRDFNVEERTAALELLYDDVTRGRYG